MKILTPRLIAITRNNQLVIIRDWAAILERLNGIIKKYPAADRQGDKYPSEIVSWFAQREENRVKVDNDGGSLNPRFDIPPLV